MSRIVVDNSVAIRWFIGDQATVYSTKVFDACENAAIYVPALWFSEFCNVISKTAKQGAITEAQATGIMQHASLLPIIEAKTPPLGEIYKLANQFGLSGYDATYLAVTIASDAMLATEDDQLAKVAKTLGVYFS
ncbi:MAG: type II toxin-antitoxin system VapC family toxin [Methylophilaceae bacterium]